MYRLLLLLILVTATRLPGQEQGTTPENWTHHPEIVEIRGLYNHVEASVQAGDYTASSKSTECYEGRVKLHATLYADSTGIVRKYELEGGTGDSASEVAYYYDRLGILRFTFKSLRAVNGSHIETRMYFDQAGNELYKDERLLKGPGWAEGFPLSVANPQAHFNDLCGP